MIKKAKLLRFSLRILLASLVRSRSICLGIFRIHQAWGRCRVLKKGGKNARIHAKRENDSYSVLSGCFWFLTWNLFSKNDQLASLQQLRERG